jgi:hypothetical protein
MSNFFSKGNFRTSVAADVAAGIDFAVVNFDLSNSAETHIYNIEASAFADIATDDPNLLLGTVRIFRNVLVTPGENLVAQLGPGSLTFWEGRTEQNRDHNFSRTFSTPFILDSGFRYAVVVFFNYSAALIATVSTSLFVNGIVVLPDSKEFFGKTR